MESLHRDCKREFNSKFGGGRAGACPQCSVHINSNLARHIMDFHLELGQLWRCLVEWCSLWKGTAQDCMDHLCIKHQADPSVELKTWGRYFPPWTVTRAAWNAVLRPNVSGIATDIMLFHQYGGRLVHRYRIYAYSIPHGSLHGPVMLRLACFAIQASADGPLQVTGILILRRIPTWSGRPLGSSARPWWAST